MTVKPCVVYTTHSSSGEKTRSPAWKMFVLETRIENVSSAAQRECWGKVEGQKKSKIQATSSQGTELL